MLQNIDQNQVAMSGALVQVEHRPSSQATLQICSEPNIMNYLYDILPESQSSILQRHDDVSLVIKLTL